ncbi:unnamed protein product [Microthlaspi erraticum]|uniref:TIR domain-containing protein n=1 Tax=Microthlaspi erraticum TaxID=1685480 RepID=A0A6D2K499_9BRAS|nr:unnamed protein product [Microthlaspi erraticum]
MASSSSSSSRYGVFLSFRGTDTRRTFVSHLHKALVDRGIVTFKDDDTIKTGEPFPNAILEAIQDSSFAIIVISENFTSSKWCLIELRSIMELWSVNKVIVFPIFYGVEPSDVRREDGRFWKPLKRHRRSPFAEEVPKWKEALTKVSYLQGKDPRLFKDDAAMIGVIVSEISSLLPSMLAIDFGDVVGMVPHMERLDSMMNIRSEEREVRMIGIWGMGGIGKTTIAKYLSNQYSRQFSACCFIEDACKLTTAYGLVGLQEKLVSSILPEDHVKISTVEQGCHHIKSTLGHRRVFFVLDGVDSVKQIQAVAKETAMFGRGSRIVITTRDKSLLRTCGFSEGDLYEVHCLESGNSLLMFKSFAFEGGSPPCDSYEQLSIRASELAHGLPFALEAFGLCFRGKITTDDWEDELRRLETTPHENTMAILKISYNDLHPVDKNVFLHVACLFNGDSILRVKALVDNFEFGIELLSEKSLVNISTDGYLKMHAMVEQTGRQIVRQERPQDQLILWDPREVFNVLTHKSGTEKIQCLVMHICEMSRELAISCDNIRPMYNLKMIKFYKHFDDIESKLQFVSEDHLLLPNLELKLLHWDAFPLTSLPSDLHLECLVEVHLRYSNLESLWDGTPDLRNLRKLDVTGSKNLRELPNISNASELEDLIMDGCTRLQRFPRYIGSLYSLRKLNATHCDALWSLEINIRVATSFQEHCPQIILELPKESEPLQSLANLSIDGKIKFCPGKLEGEADHFSFNLERHIPLKLMMRPQRRPRLPSSCRDFKCLEIKRNNYNEDVSPFRCHSFSDFPNLTELNLISLKMNDIPSSIGELQALEKLNLSGNDFEDLPRTMEQLSSLKYLDLHSCCNLKALPPLTQVETLILSDCINLRSLMERHEDQGRYRLLELDLDNCNKVESLSDQLNHFTDLIELDLSRHDFETVPASIKELSSLRTLNLNDCKRLRSLEELPLIIECLFAHGCCVLESVPLSLDQYIDLTLESGSLQESESPTSSVNNDDAIERWQLPIRIKPSLVLLGSVTCFMLFFVAGMVKHNRRRSQPTFRPPHLGT